MIILNKASRNYIPARFVNYKLVMTNPNFS